MALPWKYRIPATDRNPFILQVALAACNFGCSNLFQPKNGEGKGSTVRKHTRDFPESLLSQSDSEMKALKVFFNLFLKKSYFFLILDIFFPNFPLHPHGITKE